MESQLFDNCIRIRFGGPKTGTAVTPRDFLQFVAQLTGTEVKGEIDSESLADILIDDGRPIDCSQLNELLLFVRRTRIRT